METILTIEEEVPKIQLLEIEPQIELVEEEVRTTDTEIHVRIAKLEVGIGPLVVVQVETTKIIVEETSV